MSLPTVSCSHTTMPAVYHSNPFVC